MKALQKTVYCSRCGDQLSQDELMQLDGSTCAFCDNIRAEALQIQEHMLKNSKHNDVVNIKIVKTSSAIENGVSLP